MFSEHRIFRLSARYQNTTKVSSSPFLFVEKHVKSLQPVLAGMRRHKDDAQKDFLWEQKMVPFQYLLCQTTFQGLLTNKPMGTQSKLMQEMAPAAGQVCFFPLAPGSLPLSRSGLDERSQQKMVCTLTQQEFPGRTLWFLQRGGLRNCL